MSFHPPVIETDHLFFSYPNNSVLSDVSIKVQQGEFIGLIGPNGGGKTTFLKLITGFIKPTSGTIHVFGNIPKSGSGTQLHLAYVPQTTRFDRNFPVSVFEVVLSGLLSRLPWYGRFHQTERDLAFYTLEKVNMQDFAKKPFGTLSGGQAQRVLIARALVSDPKLLLLDEPTASVDSKAEADIFSILKELKGKMTILMVTHDLQAAIEHVERVYCVQGNVFPLKPEEVCEHFTIGLYHRPLIQLKGNKS